MLLHFITYTKKGGRSPPGGESPRPALHHKKIWNRGWPLLKNNSSDRIEYCGSVETAKEIRNSQQVVGPDRQSAGDFVAPATFVWGAGVAGEKRLNDCWAETAASEVSCQLGHVLADEVAFWVYRRGRRESFIVTY